MNCSKVGCTCQATKRPVLSFKAEGFPTSPRARAEVQLGVCDEHATPDPGEWVTDAGWAQICVALRAAGRAAPDRKTLRVEYLTIN